MSRITINDLTHIDEELRDLSAQELLIQGGGRSFWRGVDRAVRGNGGWASAITSFFSFFG
jgi:hypothetical protein